MSTPSLATLPGREPNRLDPMSAVVAASRLVDDAVAGVLLCEHGSAEKLPGLPGDTLLIEGSELQTALRTRMAGAQLSAAFLWPRNAHSAGHEYVRVTSIGFPAGMAPGFRAVVLLSPSGDLLGLTSRELEVLGLIVDGCSNVEIARELVIASRTVATHVGHLLVKLSCATRTHAALRAQREGLYVPASCAAAVRRPAARHQSAETSFPEPRP